MSVNPDENPSSNAAPFVDQLPNGPGVSMIDPADPAAPLYLLLAKMRSPVALRDLMIHPVRTGYIGQAKPIDPADLPKSATELYPDVGVSEAAVPSPAGRIRCQVFSPHALRQRSRDPRPMMLYLHGGGFTVGQSEDTAYSSSTNRSSGWRRSGSSTISPSSASSAALISSAAGTGGIRMPVRCGPTCATILPR
jgi:acetyl esterase